MKPIVPGMIPFQDRSVTEIRALRISDLTVEAKPRKRKPSPKKGFSLFELMSKEQRELWNKALSNQSSQILGPS